MGASWWDQVGLPLLIGVASSIVFAALCFLSVRLWNCLMQQLKTQTAVGDSAQDQPLPGGDAAAHANGVPDLEMGNGHGTAEGRKITTKETNMENRCTGGESMPEPELELRIVSGGQGIEHFSGRGAHPPVIESNLLRPLGRPRSLEMPQEEAALVRPVAMDIPHSQQSEEEESKCMKRQLRKVVADVGHAVVVDTASSGSMN